MALSTPTIVVTQLKSTTQKASYVISSEEGTAINEFDDHVIIVTGAESGIGLEIVRRFCSMGARVHAIGLNVPLLKLLERELGEDRVSTSVADVIEIENVQSAVAAAISRWGKIDVVVSNAGIAGSPTPVEQYNTDLFRRVLGVHVIGAFNVMQATLPHLQTGANIIVTASTAGLRGYANMSAYVAAKHGQIGLVKAVALEVAARGIRVNAVAPGPTSTSMQDTYATNALKLPIDAANAVISEGIPIGRYNTTAEIANAVTFLSSSAASSITGTVLVVDGGCLA